VKINRYQFYLILFFIIFLSGDIAFIFIAKNLYSNNTLEVDSELDNSQLSNFFQIRFEPTNEKNIFNLLLKFNNNILMGKVAIQLYNVENKKIIDSFVYSNLHNNNYKFKINSLETKRLILRINLNSSFNKRHFLAYRVILHKNKHEITQIN
jgi:hypothetical protein